MVDLVVGVVASRPSLQALDWAMEAAAPGGSVTAVTAVRRPAYVPGVEHGGALENDVPTGSDVDTQHSRWTHCRDIAQVTLLRRVVCSDVASGLRLAGDDADAHAMVIGRHVRSGFSLDSVGHIARTLLSTLERPLIFVPASVDLSALTTLPVVVGVGHGDATAAAVAWGARWAHGHGVPLGLEHATSEQPASGFDSLFDLFARYVSPKQRAEWMREDIARFAADAASLVGDDLPISTTATAGLPAGVLAAASESASLLVVGRHRSDILPPAHTTALLKRVLKRAVCPVAVVPVAADIRRP